VVCRSAALMEPMFGIARSMMNLGMFVMYWIGSLQLAGLPLERPAAANSNGQHHLDKTLCPQRCQPGPASLAQRRSAMSALRPPTQPTDRLKWVVPRHSPATPAPEIQRQPCRPGPSPPPTGGGSVLHSSNTRAVQVAQMPRSSRAKIVAIAMRLAAKMWSGPSSSM
jgi:hypothetical protein